MLRALPHPARAVLAAAAAVMLSGCASRKPELVCRNELDIPGECPAAQPSPPPLDLVIAADSTPGHVWGTVLNNQEGAPVAFAEVSVATLPDLRTTTDSLGRFHVSLPVGARQALRIAMIGYQSRADTLEIPAEGAVVMTAHLNPQPMDGPCSGLEMICRPRERGSD